MKWVWEVYIYRVIGNKSLSQLNIDKKVEHEKIGEGKAKQFCLDASLSLSMNF